MCIRTQFINLLYGYNYSNIAATTAATNALEGLILKSRVPCDGEHARMCFEWLVHTRVAVAMEGMVAVAMEGILKKVNLRQLHLDTLSSFPKAISRRTKLGIERAPGSWRGKEL